MQYHGKVAIRKGKACCQRSQRRLLIKEVARLMKTITLKSNVITALEAPSQLSPATKDRACGGYMQQLNDTYEEHVSLVERKKELITDTAFHKAQLKMIKTNIAKLEEQVLYSIISVVLISGCEDMVQCVQQNGTFGVTIKLYVT